MGNTAQFVLLAKRILRELGALSQTVSTGFLRVQKQIGSIHDQQEAADQQRQYDEQRPQILNAELQVPEAVQRQKRTSDNRQFAVQVALAVVTFLAFLAAAIYAGIASRQLRQMKIATENSGVGAEAAQSAARTAADALTQMKISSHADLRAYLRVIPGSPKLTEEKEITFETSVTNVGKTPARKVTSCIKAVLLDAMEKPDFTYGAPNTGHPCGRVTTGPLLPTIDLHMVMPTGTQKSPDIPVVFNPDEIKRMDLGKSYILVHGMVTYEDIFGTSHWVTFCSYFPISRNDRNCSKHNDIDTNQ